MLERSDAARRAVAGGAIVAAYRSAKIRAAAAAVASRHHVVQRSKMRIRVRSIVDRARVARKRVHTGDDRRRDTRPSKDKPSAGVQSVGVVNRNAGVWIGVGRDVGNGTPRTTGVILPA